MGYLDLLLQRKHSFYIIYFSILIFIIATSWKLFSSLPEIDEKDRSFLKVPRSLNDTKLLGDFLVKYKETYYYDVLLRICVMFIILQSFALPGTIFFSLLSGYLFGAPIALIVVCTCSAVGATFCYCLSNVIGRHFVIKYFSEFIKKYQQYISSCDNNLFFYMLFLRITPILPNWIINIVSPIIGIPLWIFFAATFIGVAPPSLIVIYAGTTLQTLTSVQVVWSWKSVISLIFCAFLSLAPIIYQRKSGGEVKATQCVS